MCKPSVKPADEANVALKEEKQVAPPSEKEETRDTIFIPLDLRPNEVATFGQRVRTVVALGTFYTLFTRKFRPVLESLFARHRNWKNLHPSTGREGTFCKDAMSEVLYVFSSGVHHVLGALVGLKALSLGDDAFTLLGQRVTGKSLYLAVCCWEYGFEWGDWATLLARGEPYNEWNPLFSLLVTLHHSFGLLTFSLTGSKDILKFPEFSRAMLKVLGVAGFSCMMYPFQQLCDLTKRSGIKTALSLNVVNTLMFVYVRFYLFPKTGYKFLKENFLEKKDLTPEEKKMHKWQLPLVLAGTAGLTGFNLLILSSSLGKIANYRQLLKELKTKKL